MLRTYQTRSGVSGGGGAGGEPDERISLSGSEYGCVCPGRAAASAMTRGSAWGALVRTDSGVAASS